MRCFISFGIFSFKYFIYGVLFAIFKLYVDYYIYYSNNKNDENANIYNNHKLLNSFCFFLGYLLNIIPEKISNKKSKLKKSTIGNGLDSINSIKYIYNKPDIYLSTKDIIKFIALCLMLFFLEFIEVILDKLNKDNVEQYEDEYLLFKFLIVFLLPKCFKEVYYKHQNISIIFLIVVEIIKTLFYIEKDYTKKNFAIIIFLKIIYSSLSAIYYLYIKDLMKYKYISPYKCNFMIGIINFPLLIIIMFIISYTPFGKKENKNIYCDNIIELFNDIVKLNAIYIILLILLPFIYGILLIILNKTIYNFTVYHTLIPFLVEKFIVDILNNYNSPAFLLFLISSFFIELMMILVFLEIIEINVCGLNENLRRNIEYRGIIDSSLINEDNNDERNTVTN